MTKNLAWWKVEESGKTYLSLIPNFDFIKNSQISRQNSYLAYSRLYTNRDFLSFDSDQYSYDSLRNSSKITFNITQSVIDSICAKISKNKVRPMFLTQGGNYKSKRKAEQLQKFVDGIFYENKAYDVAPMVFRDGAIFGNGYIKHFEIDGRPKMERKFPANIFVDTYESKYTSPRNLYEYAEVDKEALLALYKDKELQDKIKNAREIPYHGPGGQTIRLVRVVEAWHLPSFNGAGDGRHAICLDSGDLLVEPWEFSGFPFSEFKWGNPLIGYYAQGIAEILTTRQFEISYILKRIQRAIHRMTAPYIFVSQGTQFDTSQLTNEIGAIIKYTGEHPTSTIFASVAPEMLNHLQWLIDKSYEEVGLSQLSAGSRLPAGLESRVAIREYNDIESERFNLIGQKYEYLSLNMASKQIDLARYIYKKNGEMKVLAESGDKDLATIDWSEIDLEEDQFIMQVWPTSLLPQTPSGKLDKVDRMLSTGLIDINTGRKLLDFPDTESAVSRLNAPAKLIDKIIYNILEKGEVVYPETYMDLELAVKDVGNAYQLAKIEGVEEEKLELFREFLEACYDLQKPPDQPPPPMVPDDGSGQPMPPVDGSMMPMDPNAMLAPQQPLPPGAM